MSLGKEGTNFGFFMQMTQDQEGIPENTKLKPLRPKALNSCSSRHCNDSHIPCIVIAAVGGKQLVNVRVHKHILILTFCFFI